MIALSQSNYLLLPQIPTAVQGVFLGSLLATKQAASGSEVEGLNLQLGCTGSGLKLQAESREEEEV